MPDQLRLEDGLNDAAVIRTTFETLDLFPPDDPIRAELQTPIASARDNLICRLQTLRDQALTEPGAFQTGWEKFRAHALKLMTRGCPRRKLDAMMKLTLFDEGESSLYYLETEGLLDIEEARRMPAHRFAALLINEALQSAQNPAHYTDKATFDRWVFQKCVILTLISWLITDPMFYDLFLTE